MGLFALGTFVAVCLVSSVSSCSCETYRPQRRYPMYLQDMYCKANYVIQIKVVGLEDIGDQRKYTVNDTVVFKSSPEYDAVVDKTSLYTEVYGCGASLRLGTTYILSGSTRDGKLRVHLCDLIRRQLSELTEAQLCYLRTDSGYAKGCKDCKIQYCKNEEECDAIEWDPTTCISNQNGLEFSTRDQNTVCTLVNKRYCEWSIVGEPLRSNVCKAKGR